MRGPQLILTPNLPIDPKWWVAPSHLSVERTPPAVQCSAIKQRKKMKTKTWTVISNTGKLAELESGLEKHEVQKPTHISAREFVRWLAPETHIDDQSLRSLFKR